jgi:hypothetical protein
MNKAIELETLLETVHCLVCDCTYPENAMPPIVEACPHCGNSDKDQTVYLSEEQVEFKEAIYELAFGDNAINRGFSEEEVIATIKGFAHDSWVAEELDHEPSHSAREHWNANKAAEIEEQEDHNMNKKELEEMVANAEEALDKLPDETFIPISNYIDFLKKLSEENDR